MSGKDENISTVRLLIEEIYEDNHEHITQKISKNADGILSCQFLHQNNEVLITFNKNLLDQYKILSSIEELGYSVELKDSESVQAQLRIEGMHCNSCVSNICDAILELNGAIDIQLTFLDKLAIIIYDPSLLQLNDIIDEIEKLSFQVAISNAPQIKIKNENNNRIHTTTTTNNLFLSVEDEIEIRQRKSTKKVNINSSLSIKDNKTEFKTCYFNVLGMTCASCVDNIQRNLSKIEGYSFILNLIFILNKFLKIGIHLVLVALLSQRAEVKYDPSYILPSQIAGFINNLGFQAEILETAARGMETIDINVRFILILNKILFLF
jgi:Cu+-exporting ATPase